MWRVYVPEGHGMRDRSDRELVRASQEGSAEAFGVLVRRYETQAYAVTFGALLDRGDAEDAAQNAFLKAWERLHTLRQPESFPAWLARIACTCVADIRRRGSREAVMDVHAVFADEPQPTVDQEQFAVRDDIARLVEAGLRALPEGLRAALTMRYIGQQTYTEIAENLAVSENAAHRRVSTARARLREYFVRAGTEQECLDLLHSRWLVAPSGLAVAGPVMELVETRGAPGARKAALAPSAGLLPAFVGALAVVVSLLVGLSLRAVDITTLAGRDAGIPVDTFTRRRPDNQTALFAPTAPARVLVRPGDEDANWLAWMPNTDARIPEVTVEQFSTPPFGMVSHNTEGAYRTFEPARGEVTCELWLKPARGVYDTHLCLLSDGQQAWPIRRGWAWYDGVAIRKHGSSGWWQHGSPHQPIDNNISVPYTREPGWTPFAPVEPGGQHIRIVHHTPTGRYDIYLNGRLMARDVHAPKTQGKPITGIWIGGFAMNGSFAPAPTYFDDLRVTVRPIRRWSPHPFAGTTGP